MFKTIIFDIGGVIVDFTEEQYIAFLSKKLGVSKRYLSALIFPIEVQMEYGRMTLKRAEKIFSKEMLIPNPKLYWVQGFKSKAKVNKPVLRLVEKLSKRYPIVLLSNVAESRYREISGMGLDRLIKSRAVQRVFTSYAIGLRKPDIRIYKYVLKEMKINPKEALFIDNQPENVLGAQRAGIRGIHFTNYRRLVRDLKTLGVL